jgi:hypothetical protein
MSSIAFNPFSGQFDYVGTSGGGIVVPTYELAITNNTQWGVASGGIYSITILASNHGHGVNPLVQCLETNGSNYDLIIVAHKLNASGDITIEVDETPDNRFLGKILIGE